VVVRAEPSPGDTTGPAAAAPGPHRARIGPALGDGKLWVPPLPLPPRELAAALSRTHIELVDSAVTAIVQAYIDSVLAAPSSAAAGPPAWTTKIGGQTIGLDAKYIYLGPIKLPTFLLALLPLGNAGAYNIDMTKAYQFQLMREDLQLAAQRSQTMEDFKRAIRELREQREREREFAKNQRSSPKPKTKPKAKADSTVAKSPTP